MITAALSDLLPFRSIEVDLEKVEAGLPISAIDRFVSLSGFELRDMYDVVIPARTLKHRKSRREALSRDESDKLARVARVFDLAVRILGGPKNARSWLQQPKRRFSERNPLEILRTEFGGRLVEEMLGQIDEGMFA